MTGFHLKILALIAMLIDHIGAVLFPQILWLRYIGRLSFPIYCFLVGEGLWYTRDLKKYLLRMGAFALLSEIPFDLAFHGTVWYWQNQNVFFTLFLGLAAGASIKCVGKKHPLPALLLAMGCVVAAEFLHTDYGAVGVCFILCFSFFRNRAAACSSFAVLNTVKSLLAGVAQHFALCAVIPILLYSGDRGRKTRRYVFYALYPIHLLVLWSLSQFIR